MLPPVMKAHITILGSGSSPGVPYLGCSCDVCRSTDPRDQRTRCGTLVEIEGFRYLIDTPPDLRAQCLREHLYAIDAVLFTHTHADHLNGIDDLRAFNYLMGRPTPCYAPTRVLNYLRGAFPYLFSGGPDSGGGKPALTFHPLDQPTRIGPVEVEPLELPHTPVTTTTGYRFGALVAMLLDCRDIPDETIDKVAGLRCAVVDLVQHTPGHDTHLWWDKARRYAGRIGAGVTIYSHLGHEILYRRDQALLLRNELLAYDGLSMALDSSTEP